MSSTELTDTTVRVRAAVCPLHADARISSPQVSQALHGALLTILETRDDWRRVRGADAYEGWAHRGYLVDAADDAAGWSSPRWSLGCTVRMRGGASLALPLGARVHADATVVHGEAIDEPTRARRFPPTPAAIAASAVEHYAGASYQWGGVTPWGADCSGFVQTVFRLHGITLPRDAWQQALMPDWSPVLEGLAELQAGDLLFFSDREDGRITHVGIAVDGARMVHLALGRGGYAVERFPADRAAPARDAAGADGYVAALLGRFRSALRPPLPTRG